MKLRKSRRHSRPTPPVELGQGLSALRTTALFAAIALVFVLYPVGAEGGQRAGERGDHGSGGANKAHVDGAATCRW